MKICKHTFLFVLRWLTSQGLGGGGISLVISMYIFILCFSGCFVSLFSCWFPINVKKAEQITLILCGTLHNPLWMLKISKSFLRRLLISQSFGNSLITIYNTVILVRMVIKFLDRNFLFIKKV